MSAAAIVLGATIVLAACGDPDTSSGLAAPRPITASASRDDAVGAATETADLSIGRLGAPISSITFVAGDGLGPLPADTTGWEFPAGALVDEAAVRRLADALGVSGEFVVLSEDEGGGWRIGPNDGSAPSLTVAASAALDWYYSPAYATVGVGRAEPGFAGEGEPVEVDPALVDPVEKSETSVQFDDVPAGTVAPDAPIDVPTDTVALPQNVPTQSDAEARARELAAAVGLDPDDFEMTSYADDYSASVTFLGDPARGTAGRSFDVGFGENGAVQWASGQLAAPIATGPFPLIDLDEALERLDEQYDWTDQTFRDDVITIDPMPVDAVPGDDVTVVDGGDSAGGGTSSSPGATDIAVAPPDADTPVASPEPKPGDLLPADEMPVDPQLEPVDLVVTLTSVKAGLWWTVEVDGTVWLLPAYEFIGDDGGTYLVPAVTDEFLVEAPAPEPIPEPMPTEPTPDTEPPVEPGPVETEPNLPAPTEPPVTEPAPMEIPADLELVGRTVDEATALATDAGFELRVVEIDGEPLAVTADFRPNRINVAVVDDILTAVQSLG